MSPANPYLPPTAPASGGENIDGPSQPPKLSTFKGRIGRLRYLAWTCGAYLVVFGLAAIGGLLAGAAGAGDAGDVVGVAGMAGMAGMALQGVLSGIAGMLFLIFWVFWTIQRSHDMGWSGWTWLWTLIPLVVLIWIFKGGDKGANRYGGPPPPNGLGVHLLAWLLPLIFFFGIAAAIAIPAYNGYNQRVSSVQTI